MKRSFLFLCVLILAVAVASPSLAAPPVTVVDQTQPVVDMTVGGLAIGADSDQMLAQTVTAGLDGALQGLFLPVSCVGRAVLNVEIQGVTGTGEPDGTVLGHRFFRGRRLGSLPFGTFVYLPLPRVALLAGDQYAIVLKKRVGTSGNCAIASSPLGSTYDGGEAFFDARPNQPGWVRFSETDLRHDLPFTTVMRMH